MCRSEARYPIWGPDEPPLDALERSFAWLAELATPRSLGPPPEATWTS